MNKRRSGLRIMAQLIGLVKPMIPMMCVAILLGVLGFLCAIFVTVCAIWFLFHPQSLQIMCGFLLVLAILRGVFHYGEQYCNHYIAFSILALIRHKVFAHLRTLAPAKLEEKEAGNLVTLLTSDIELLEVFYAHTISPMFIAFFTCFILLLFFLQVHVIFALIALCGYLVIGVVIPIINAKMGSASGMRVRNQLADLNTYVLESLYGIEESIQYQKGEQRLETMIQQSKALEGKQHGLAKQEGRVRSISNLFILISSIVMFMVGLYYYQMHLITLEQMLFCTVLMMSSFGPVLALANVSNNLNYTFASGERVLSLLEEEAIVQEVVKAYDEKALDEMEVAHVDFAYGDEVVLHDFNAEFTRGKIYGLLGKSGCGKSTLLKLLMRFWDVDAGNITMNKEQIQACASKQLKAWESTMSQDCYLFQTSIKENVKIAKVDASDEEVINACKKANIHEYITSLEQGYDTQVAELGDSLSAGEKQRIGLARVFLHDGDVLLLDEPTANIDAMNEGSILKSLKEHAKDKCVIVSSHKPSTLKIANVIYRMKAWKQS